MNTWKSASTPPPIARNTCFSEPVLCKIANTTWVANKIVCEYDHNRNIFIIPTPEGYERVEDFFFDADIEELAKVSHWIELPKDPE